MKYFYPVAEELLSKRFYKAVLQECIDKHESLVIGDLTGCISRSLKSPGLTALTEIMLEHGAKNSTILWLFKCAFDRRNAELERLLLQLESQKSMTVELLSDSVDEVLCLHYLRSFLISSNTELANEIRDKLKPQILFGLDTRFHALIVPTSLVLAHHKQHDDLCSMVHELASFDSEWCLESIVSELARRHDRTSLKAMSQYLIRNSKVATVISLSLFLARQYTLEAKTMASEVIRESTSVEAFHLLIKESSHVNHKLADALVRQLALSEKAENLKLIAIQLATANDEVALYLVLDQLFSMIPDFPTFIHNISNEIKDERIELLGKWLKAANLETLIEERVQTLYAEKNEKLARKWQRLLAASK